MNIGLCPASGTGVRPARTQRVFGMFATRATQRDNDSRLKPISRHGNILSKSCLLALACLALIGHGKAAQASGTSWNNTSTIFGAAAMTADTQGNVFATGIGEVGYQSPYAYTASYSKSGALRWFVNYPNFDAADPLAIAADGQGGAATAGFTYTMLPNSNGQGYYVAQELLVVKYDTTGHQTWARTYLGTNTQNSSASAKAVAIDAAGDVYVTGVVTNNGTGNDLVLIKLDGASGAQDWCQAWDDGSNGSDTGSAIALDASGNVYCGGSAGSTNALLKYNASTGALAWSSAVAAPGGVGSIAPSGAYVYVAGSNVRQFLASNGTQNWATPTYGGISQVAVDAAGEVFGVGASTFPIGGPPTGGVVTFRFNPGDGSLLWQQAYQNASPAKTAIAVDSGGSVYVTGSTPSSSATALVALKYNASGTQLDFYTTPTYASTTTDIGIGTDGNGDAFLIGLTPTSGNSSTSSVLAVGLLGF